MKKEQKEKAIGIIDSLVWKNHREVDDGFYSCPLAENYIDTDGNERKCDCGLEAHNEKLRQLKELIEL